MGGWKTWASVGLITAATLFRYWGLADLAEAFLGVGTAMGLWGVGHKLDRIKK